MKLKVLDLLLQILEQPEPVITGAAAEDHYPCEVDALIEDGLLQPDGDDRVTSDEFDRPVLLEPSPIGQGLGYFDAETGWTDISPARLRRYRVDLPKLIAAIVSTLDPDKRQPRRELIADLLWEWGDVRLPGRRGRHSLWFARHLGSSHNWRQLLEISRLRPAPASRRIILTSTPAERLGRAPHNHLLIYLADVMADGLALDPQILAARLDDRPRSEGDPIVIKADGRVVEFYGQTFEFPRGDTQRRVVVYLHACLREGQRWVPVAQIASELDLAPSIRMKDLFRGSPAWGKLLTARNGACGFCLPEEPA